MKTNESTIALAYDDVVILPGYLKAKIKYDRSTFLCKDRHGHDLVLKRPFLTAAMDTVTEADMAIALAQEGGMGTIHANLSPAQQAEQVRRVKRAENFMISDPVCVLGTTSIKEVANLILQPGGKSSIPVLDQDGKILGLAVKHCVRYQEKKFDLPITQTMVKEPIIVRPQDVKDKVSGFVSLEKAREIFANNTQSNTKALLVADKNNKLLGIITSKDVENLKTHPNACKDHNGRLRVAAAIDTQKNTMERVRLLVKAEVDLLVIDSSQGYSDFMANTIRAIKKEFPTMPVVAGNVVTAEGAIFLAKAGADIIKVGIGPGAICSTRKISGVGLSQFSAIIDVCEALKKFPHITVIADGGIKQTGDIGKAIVAGADAVMMGSVFAGTDEAPGEIIMHEGIKVKTYRGMGSIDAMKAGSGGRYEQNNEALISHGVVAYVPYKGTVVDIIAQYAGGLRETMKLTGASNLAELKKAKWRQITHAGEIESHPHDVKLAHEEPNYR